MPVHSLNIAKQALGQLVGGKYGANVACPVCGRPSILYRRSRKDGVFFVEYAHRIELDLDLHNEPVAQVSEICRRADDPSPKAARRAK